MRKGLSLVFKRNRLPRRSPPALGFQDSIPSVSSQVLHGGGKGLVSSSLEENPLAHVVGELWETNSTGYLEDKERPPKEPELFHWPTGADPSWKEKRTRNQGDCEDRLRKESIKTDPKLFGLLLARWG